jgi:divalent metal cation (Fe/Co/Zn/Cd) transporter
MHPSAVHFSMVAMILILISIPLKVTLSLFERHIGTLIKSSALNASSFDALGDVFVLGAAAISLMLSFFTKLPVDGYIGVLVALFIMYAGFRIARKAFGPLLGEPPDPALVNKIKSEVLHYPYITGAHDLMVHNYGPCKCIASIHAEVPCDLPVVKLHEVIDTAEKEISAKLNIILVIHMDPLNNDDKDVKDAKADLLCAIKFVKGIESIHDFRVVGGSEKKNLIFDVVVESDVIVSKNDESVLMNEINTELKKMHPFYTAIINVDRDFT